MQATLNDYLIDKARTALTYYMVQEADKLRRQLGFGYIESAGAPNTYKQLQEAWRASTRDRTPLPVYDGGSDRTIYMCVEGNYAFRFVHDAAHVLLQANFQAPGEARVFEYLGNKLAKHFGRDSLEYKLYAADTIGQTAYYQVHQKFAGDQLSLVKSLLTTY